MAVALQDSGLSLREIHCVVGTGYGRVNVPFAQKSVTEISCHARGANFIYGPEVRTILDMGGQDCKVIRCDQNGKVINFLMNDKCAAGTGRGMEVLANLLSVPVAEMGPLSLQVDEEPEPVSSMCVVFAKTEAIGLMRKGWPKEKVLAAYSAAMAHRVVELLERIGVEREFASSPKWIRRSPGLWEARCSPETWWKVNDDEYRTDEMNNLSDLSFVPIPSQGRGEAVHAFHPRP
jgi:predicted CoA-substrate-specific enzyme activase